ncbi:MAG: AgmX/PglI C-terminal domain-containing protein [Myxococcota bacterium]
MEACPFCSTSIDESVVIYGGTCPGCFANIPGEEAATDPGEDVKLAQAASDRKRAKRRALMPLLVATPVVLLVAAGAIYLATRPAPELAVLDFDDNGGQFYTPDLDVLIVATTADEPPIDAKDVKQSTVKTAGNGQSKSRMASDTRDVSGRDAAVLSAPKIGGRSNADDAALLAQLGSEKTEDVAGKVRGGSDLTPTGIADDLDIAKGMGSSSVGSGGFQMDAGRVSQSGPPLSDPQKIAYMVQKVLRRQLPRLRPCYESSLRASPDLRGSWIVTFTVETDGSVGKAKATGSGVSDANLESCLVRRVNSWRFSRIVKPQPVKKTVEFKK